MQVLTLRRGQSVLLDTAAGTVRVQVVSRTRRKVRIGVEAARAIPVDREEIHRDKLARGGARA